ncbi:MAG: prenyltransferase [Myxococcales bacterium]|nr:prenyltransferase [Myxococcales bacterium]
MAWWPWGRPLDAAGVARLAAKLGQAHDPERAWALAEPLRAAIAHPDVALALADNLSAFGPERGLELARVLLAQHGDRPTVLAALGRASDALVDLDDLNRPPPTDPWFAEVVDRLGRAVEATTGDLHLELLRALAAAATTLGRAGDVTAERAHRAIATRAPDLASIHYNHGLFFKTRGRWAEGQAANQRALDLREDDDEATWWNLGLCATGAGDGATALAAWSHLGQKVALGRFDLPEGSYRMAKVRLAQRPLAERGPDADDPGRGENGWVERLSGGHGILRVAVFADDLGLEYGDVVMFDGAPVGYHGDEPLFPHLATLRRQRYQVWRFAGTQATPRQLRDLSADLPEDTIVYPHTEQVRILCGACARGRGGDGHDHTAEERHHVVRGKVCAPPHLAPADVLAALDAAIAASPGAQLYAPALSAAAGDDARADVDQRRYAMLTTDADA